MKSKILIIEDELIEAMSFEQSLKSVGYTVVGISSTGEDALRKVAELKPDLVLMDIILKGDMDGIEAATKIKDDFDIPVVYLTAHPEKSTLDRAKLTAPYGYLIKPVNKTVLKNTIDMALYKHQMDNKLKKSEQRFRAVAESAVDGIVTTDVDGVILLVNESLGTIFGYSRDELIGENLTILMPERLKKDYLEGLETYKESGVHRRVGKTLKTRGLRKNGTEFPFEMSLYAWKSGEKIYFTSIIRDITERKKAEEALKKSESFLNDIVNQSPHSMWISDSQGNLIRINQACLDLFNISAEEVVDKYNIFNDDIVKDQGFMPQVKSVFNEGKTVTFQLVYDTKQFKHLALTLC